MHKRVYQISAQSVKDNYLFEIQLKDFTRTNHDFKIDHPLPKNL